MHVLKGPLSTFSSKKLFPGSTYINAKNIALAYLGGSVIKNPPANAEETGGTGLIPGSGRSPGVGNPLQYS